MSAIVTKSVIFEKIRFISNELYSNLGIKDSKKLQKINDIITSFMTDLPKSFSLTRAIKNLSETLAIQLDRSGDLELIKNILSVLSYIIFDINLDEDEDEQFLTEKNQQ